MCFELMLIIEADGGYHNLEEVAVKDKKRQADLEAEGFTVIRFTNEEILYNIHGVCCFLEEWIEKKVNGPVFK